MRILSGLPDFRQKKLISCNGVYEFLYKAVLIREKDFFRMLQQKMIMNGEVI
ncbi:hypothetical protein M099_2107 [Phocaeicola vulgatus str. 3975 RP4]|uniref:Uncharacterized protein n=1 Tax=Phocaeicola vulgatus str. 3975 RP4 TaxID=1339352 RepID=A0A069SPV0_PHOVU|nr:hypothetical protein M099_2107 [Phocaeicola vulgatus str. 3975 RP4]